MTVHKIAPKAASRASPVIERGIPIPSRADAIYRFDEMEPGDSFPVETGAERVVAMQSAARYKKKHPACHFISRVMKDHTYRIWREK